MAKRKAQVGDFVRIIKNSIYDEYDIDIGDIGVVNYIASTTGKYSVHIDGKKNPHDIEKPGSRKYGNEYDFWILPNSCEVIETKFKVGDSVDIHKKNCSRYKSGIVKGYCMKNNMFFALVLVDNIIPNTQREDGCRYFLEKDLSTSVWIEDTWLEDIHEQITNNTGREETIMKEIKNQKVVELYFKRKDEALEKERLKKYDESKEEDKHYKFIISIQEQINDYIAQNDDLKDVHYDALAFLPLEKESSERIMQLNETYREKRKDLNEKKEEVLTMLSGCETYDQEMVVLNSYGIVSYGKYGDMEAKMKN